MTKYHKNINQDSQVSLFDEIDSNSESDFLFHAPKSAKGAKKVEDEGENNIIEAPAMVSDLPLFRFISFGSGSSGNCAFVGNEHGGVLIDAGVDEKTVFESLKAHGISPEEIKGICLTHDHGDHIRYAYAIVRKHRHIHIYCTNRVMNGILRRHNISRRIKDMHVAIYKEIPFDLGGLKITAFEVPHDGSDNSGFYIEYAGRHFSIATDIGHISERAYHYLTKAHYLMLESNYDSDMLTNGRYPEYLKNRIRAANGHLDNKDAARFIADNYKEELKYIFLCHLSHDNNTPDIAKNEIISALAEKEISVGNGEDTLEDKQKSVQLVALPRFESSRLFILREDKTK